MKLTCKRVVPVVLTLVTGISSLPETFAAQTGPLQITRIRTGWAADQFAIETNQPILNPAGCPTPDGYALTYSDAGYKTHYAATLLAFSMAKPVMVAVSDTECVVGRPKIWGINLSQ